MTKARSIQWCRLEVLDWYWQNSKFLKKYPTFRKIFFSLKVDFGF
jgi:hypothetical protein